VTERVVLVLTPAAGFAGDPWVRLRRWLKLGLRVFGGRAELAEVLPPAAAEVADEDQEGAGQR
jgi:hypothetical protein